MLRTLFIGVFLLLALIVVGIPLLIYTVIRRPDVFYWEEFVRDVFVHGLVFECALPD